MEELQKRILDLSKRVLSKNLSPMKYTSKEYPGLCDEFLNSFGINGNASLLPHKVAPIDYLILRNKQNMEWAFQRTAEGIELARKERYVEAIKKYEMALELDARCIDAYVARGAAYANQSKYLEAITDLRVALEINPNHRNAQQYLSRLLKNEQERQTREREETDGLLNGEFMLVELPDLSQRIMIPICTQE
jgi:tetratricopeptide (TPR) repeat protein